MTLKACVYDSILSVLTVKRVVKVINMPCFAVLYRPPLVLKYAHAQGCVSMLRHLQAD